MAVDIIARAMAAKANSGGGNQPDLSNYVQFDDYATNNKTGVINGNINGFQVSSSGNPYAKEYTAEEYDNVGNQDFIGKGTLENAKDKIVGSSTPVKNLNNSLRDLTPKQDAKGTDNVFDDGLKSPLYALGGDGKSEQVTTTGKNLFDTSSLLQTSTVIGTSVGNIYTLKPNTQYTISTNMVSNPNSTNGIDPMIGDPQNNNAYVFVSTDINIEDVTSNNQGVGTLSNKTKTITTDSTGNLYIGLRGGFTDEFNTFVGQGGYIQIEEGSTATSYEPYTGGQPSPSSEYKQPINSIEGSLEFACRGKNWLNYDLEITNYFYNSNGEQEKDSTGQTYVNQEFLVYNNKQFVFNFSKLVGNPTLRMCEYDVNGNFIKRTLAAVPKAITLDYNTYKVIISINKSDTKYFENPQLEIGTQSTEHEPYVEPNEVIFNLNEEKLRSVGDVKDELVVDLSTGDYYKVENVGEVVLDGSTDENWGNVPDGTSKERYTSSIIQNLVYTGTKLCQSNYFKGSTSENYYEDGTIRIAPSGGVSIYDDLFTSMDNFKQWLSTNNTIVNYILKKPTTKKLGTLSAEDLAKLKTFKGYNNVTVNTNLGLMNIRFIYGLDIKKYVDNKLAEILSALI